jgi:hypothetical protein
MHHKPKQNLSHHVLLEDLLANVNLLLIIVKQ